jgi:hypothetical protein
LCSRHSGSTAHLGSDHCQSLDSADQNLCNSRTVNGHGFYSSRCQEYDRNADASDGDVFHNVVDHLRFHGLQAKFDSSDFFCTLHGPVFNFGPDSLRLTSLSHIERSYMIHI